MESTFLEVALSQGIWAGLAVALIFYNLRAQQERDRAQDERESKFQEIIMALTEKLNILEDLKSDLNIFIKKTKI